MAFLVDQGAAKDFAHFIDAIGELVAAVVDMNHGVAVQDIATIDISYPAHALSRFPRRSQRATLPRSKDPGGGHAALRGSGLLNSCERHGYAVASCRLPARASSRVRPPRRAPNLAERGVHSFQILVVHLRHFSGYVGAKIIVPFCSFLQAWRKKPREDTVQTSRGKLVASFAAVILGGTLLAVMGVVFTSP